MPGSNPLFAEAYLGGLADMMANFEATDREGQSLPFAEAVERAASLIQAAANAGGKLMFVGNGGSAGVASHQAADYMRNGNLPATAFNDGAMLTCMSNDLGYEQVFARPISILGRPEDVLIAISSSGQSPNILAAARTAAELGARVLTLSAFRPDNPLRVLGDINFFVPTMSYGYAEILHLAISHCILDCLIAERSKAPGLERGSLS